MGLFKQRYVWQMVVSSLVIFTNMQTFAKEASAQHAKDFLTSHNTYTKALQYSRSKQLPILVFFSGSDWDATCMKVKKNMLDSQEFKKNLSNKCIFLEVDFPKHQKLSKDIQKQNLDLKKQYNVDQLPCLMLIAPDEREIYRMSSFGNETGEHLSQHINKVLQSDDILNNATRVINVLDVQELKGCYVLAEELDRRDFMLIALEKGVQFDDYFFLLEKFRLLVEDGKMDTDECSKIKKRLLSKDPKNEKRTYFTVALVEFQELAKRSKEGVRKTTSQVIAPLENYVANFGKQDADNLWRIEMMIAQYYMESDQWNSALKHAEVAFRSAPQDIQPHISNSLEYIRDQA